MKKKKKVLTKRKTEFHSKKNWLPLKCKEVYIHSHKHCFFSSEDCVRPKRQAAPPTQRKSNFFLSEMLQSKIHLI